MNIKVLSKYILIEPEKESEITESGIIVHQEIKEKKNEGIVRDIGDEVKLNIKVGDRVLFMPYGPQEVIKHKQTFLIAKEEDILAVIT